MDLNACLELHTALDQVFATTGEVERLPGLISEVGRRFVPCEFISMWLYDAREATMANVVARHVIDGDGTADVRRGQVRLAIARGPGKGFLENLAADLVDGVPFEQMPIDRYIINDRAADARAWPPSGGALDVSGLRSEMYAPMVFNGFIGMLCALNHPSDAFTVAHFELLRVLANKAAVAVWSMRERQRAESADRLAMLGRAVDFVRHEMQSPLTIMKGASHVIRQVMGKAGERSPHDEEVLVEMVGLISTEIERNATLLDQIREYCQPTLQLRLEPGDLNEFLEAHHEAITLCLQSARRGRAEIRYNLGDSLPPLAFSRLHLLGVLRNLTRNACEVGCTEVYVTTAVGAGGASVVLAVEDDGGGVDERLLDSLFQPYESSKAMAGGSGLGLFLCRRVIEEGHAGQVRAINVYEGGVRRGLRVELHLPV